jgi:hypothetical protein
LIGANTIEGHHVVHPKRRLNASRERAQAIHKQIRIGSNVQCHMHSRGTGKGPIQADAATSVNAEVAHHADDVDPRTSRSFVASCRTTNAAADRVAAAQNPLNEGC